ncbi:DC1 domain-containing family protein [Cucumis melo var. makuwa]|uniref:DC1 domain-containing family protein n=2 Tax=Cucumis melo TaxID=3656 RepID=A0A5D3D866_CUCMM|nr:DC1 domain-containing family protein [Cucumis melo var. makuwa]TYK19660.1 DC1 domain-containing family protein [Cucumis melo var. makuwa]
MMKWEALEKPHPHPLTYIEEKTDGEEDMFCYVCKKPLYPPAFICSTCKFYIHQSCIYFPPQIHSRFHPQHSLSLDESNADHCHCCWQMPRDCFYTCSHPYCRFIIDIKCLLADTKTPGLNSVGKHFSHSHPLILEKDISTTKLVVCHLCGMLLPFGPAYFCSKCNIRCHKACGDLPQEILQLNQHYHPLFLFPLAKPNSFCNSCKNECSQFVYSCVQCNFNLHLTCRASSNHKHNFTRLRTMIRFKCLLCGWWGHDFPWFCNICHLLAHEKCAELPPSLLVVGHDCPLNFTYSHPFVNQSKLACDICRKKVEPQFAAYSCFKCSYIVHLNCAGKKYLKGLRQHDGRLHITKKDTLKTSFQTYCIRDEEAMPNDFSNKTLELETLHSNCEQELILNIDEPNDDKQCHGCMQRFPISEPSYCYNCAKCGFFLHKDCADLPITKRHQLHKHSLTLVATQDVAFQCHACLQVCHGFAYHCEECLYTLDLRCFMIKTKKLKHPSHRHLLSLAQNNDDQQCKGCGQSNKTVFECDDGCNFSLDYRCATLPQKVRCKFDGSLLYLRFSVEDETGEYYCDVCEEERNPNVCFYYCKTCHLMAHPDCILGEYPWLKYGSYETHKHPLALVTEGKMNFADCDHCGKPCTGNLAYECRRCKFNVHAIGRCYNDQILKGKLSFMIK